MLELTKENFATEVHEAKGLVFVDFWSDGCVPCKQLMPDVHAMAERHAGKMKFCAFNIGGARRLAMKEKVLGLPTMLVYKDGKEIDRVTGEDLTIEAIEEMVKKHI
ncbi:MAG: thioredoxin family protein [Treponemataceae bacterium]